MTRIIILSALLSTGVHAEPCSVGMHLASFHARPGFETVTAGAYARCGSGLTLGVLSNSYGRPSAYAAHTWETADRRLAISVGAISGYPAAPLSPLIVPSWRVGEWQGLALRVGYIPKPPRHGASSAVHVSVEIAR